MIFRPETGRRGLYVVERQNLNSSPNIIWEVGSRRLGWTGRVTDTGLMRDVYRVLLGKPEGKRHLGRTLHRPEDNINIDLLEVCWVGVDWIDLGQDMDNWWAGVNAATNLRVLSNARNFLIS